MYQQPDNTVQEILYFSNVCAHSKALMQTLSETPTWPTLQRRLQFNDCTTIRCERAGKSFVVVYPNGQHLELPLKVTQLPALEVFVNGMYQTTVLGKRKILVRLGLAEDGPPEFTPPPQSQQRIASGALQYPADYYQASATVASSAPGAAPGAPSPAAPLSDALVAAVAAAADQSSSTSSSLSAATASFVPSAPASSLARP